MKCQYVSQAPVRELKGNLLKGSTYTDVGGKEQTEPGQHREMMMMTFIITEEAANLPEGWGNKGKRVVRI